MIEHLQSRGDNACADDFADGVRRVADIFEDAQHGAEALWIARQADPDFGHDRQRPFTADNRSHQVEPRRILGRSADLDDRSVRQHSLYPQHVVHGNAVLERVRTARIGCHIAAKCAGPLARWVGCVVVTAAFQRIGQPDVHDTGLYHRIAIPNIDLDDLLHPRQDDHHAAADR